MEHDSVCALLLLEKLNVAIKLCMHEFLFMKEKNQLLLF